VGMCLCRKQRTSAARESSRQARAGFFTSTVSTRFGLTGHYSGRRRPALSLAAGALWHMPGRFGIVRFLGPRYSLRCVVFHDVSDEESPFTRGLGVTTPRSSFEAALKFLTKHYTPVRLQDVLADPDGRRLPPRPVLITFDDTYASMAQVAAPLCYEFRVPAVFFISAACLDNRQLALDNVICYVANVLGLARISAVARAITGRKDLEVRSMAEVFTSVLPGMSLRASKLFRYALVELVRASEPDLARQAGLYLTSHEVQRLAAYDCEIGNHTYTHVHCRSLSHETFYQEIDRNKVELEALSGRRVRSFSVPYGSPEDLTSTVAKHLQLSGHEAVFLSESTANREGANASQLDRVSIHGESEEAFFSEIEVLPRVRALRNRLFGKVHQDFDGPPVLTVSREPDEGD
jgi:peptidoglycan/xylan/chitin deacetylase (PgdA/CDA1 family)